MRSAATSRYAEALADIVFSSAAELKPADAVTQLRAFEALLNEYANLRHVMITPAVPVARKRAVAGDLARQLGVSRVIRNFLFVLIDHHRLPEIAEIRETLEHVFDERMGFVRADVTSAQPLNRAQLDELEQELGKITGKQVRAHYEVDPALIGGVTARVGSRRYDGSVRGQLEHLRQKLTARA